MKSRIVKVGNAEFGGKDIVVIAGPCSIDLDGFFSKTAAEVKCAGAKMLRGDIFKNRTSPFSFQGIGKDGISIIRDVKKRTGLPVVVEVSDVSELKELLDVADMFKVGARNMQNFKLLKELGKIGVPVILKRGFGCRVEELLASASYIECEGNKNIVLCERGIRSFENSTRFTLDISAIPKIKQLSDLPVIVDPSHAAGQKELVHSLSLAAIAAGADGLLIEVHIEPDKSLSDKDQTINCEDFLSITKKIELIAPTLDRSFKVDADK